MNVHGDLTGKLNNEDFIKMVSKYDIVCLTECWINHKSKLKLRGYHCFRNCRTRAKYAKRDSGGVCIFVKLKYISFVEKLEWDDFEDGLAIKFSGQYFKLNNAFV